MKIYSILILSLVFLAGCSKQDSISERVLVYENRNALQCESTGIVPSDSVAKLSAAGVAVSKTHCGHKTGVMYPAACGMGTGSILIHEIAQENLPAARQAGFEAVAELVHVEQDISYEIVECEVVE
jgi:outer membrane lipoprotein SlyB